ncbi:MAG: glycosyltransferase family 39 protein [Rhodoglobus sp.]
MALSATVRPPSRVAIAIHISRERIALAALLVGTAALYLWNLGVSGWANEYYSAAAQAGASSWTAFLYGSSDAANSITVDKPPASLWLMDLSVRVFGLSSFSILLPQALIGVATVWVLYATVRRRFPAGPALLAGGIVAVTPVAALIFRFNNPDALLVLLLTLATYFTLRGVQTGALRWVLLAGAMVGVGFLTKQLQAFLVLPVLAGVYLWAAPLKFGKRMLHALAALGAVLLAAGWWVAIVELVPAHLRPYVGGSQHNDFLEVTFGYNGFGRLSGHELGHALMKPSGGIDRLLIGANGPQSAWLLLTALVLFVVTLALYRRAPRTSARRATVVLLGATVAIQFVAFSFMAGIFHSYYTVALVPGIAGIVAIGAWELWRRRAHWQARVLLAAITAGSTVWAYVLLSVWSTWMPWLRPTVPLSGLVGALLIAAPLRSRGMQVAAASIALAGVLVGPLAYSVQTASIAHTGSNVSAGPSLVAFGRGTEHPLVQVHPYAALGVDADNYTWVAATINSPAAAQFQLDLLHPVMAIGGFRGTDPSPTLAAFQADVAAHRIHWFIPGAGSGPVVTSIVDWVEASFTKQTVGGVKVYDLTAVPAVAPAG